MFGLDDIKYDDIIGRVQSLPKQELKERYRDGGAAAAAYLLSTLRLWRSSNAQYADNGLVLAKSGAGKNMLAILIGLKDTKKKLDELEPWQVCDHYGVRSNFDLIVAMERYPFLDEGKLLPEAEKALGYSNLWAVAICHLADGASVNSLIQAYISFAQALRAENYFKRAKLVEEIGPLRQLKIAQEERSRKFVRQADEGKAQRLRKAAEQYHKLHPTYSRDFAAKALAKDKSIGLGVTRIKEYFVVWFPPEYWPRSPTGPKPKG